MKKIYIYILLIAVLGGAVYFLMNKNNGSFMGENRKRFTIENTDIVTKIFLARKDGTKILLEKQENGKWIVNKKYDVRKGQIALLLETFKRMEVRIPAAEPARKKIVNEMATMGLKVEIYAGDKKLKTYYVGGNTIDDLGTYMMMEGETQPYITIIPGFNGYLSARYFTRESDWRNREIVILDPAEIDKVQVSYTQKPESSFSLNMASMSKPILSNSKGDTTTNLDKTFVLEFLSSFQNIQYESLSELEKDRQDSVLKTIPYANITVVEKSGGIREVNLYQITRSSNPDLGYGNDGKPLEISDTRFLTKTKELPNLAITQLFSLKKTLVLHSDFLKKPVQKVSAN